MENPSEAESGHDRARVLLALTLVQVFFGLHYLAAKVLLEFIPPRAWAIVRASSAALVLLVLTRAVGRRLPSRRGDWLRLAGLSLFGVVINQICFVEGLHRTTPAHSSILMTSIPVGTLLFGVLLRRETMTGWKALSLLASLGGVMLVILSGPGSAAPGFHPARDLLGADTLVGDILTLVNALSYGLFLVLSRRLLSRIDALGATAVLMVFGALGVFLVGWPALSGFDPGAVPPRVWALAAYIVVFPTALAYLLLYWTLARVGSYLVALFVYLQPIIATTLSAALLGERPGPGVLLGGGLVFLGVYLALPPAAEAGRAAP